MRKLTILFIALTLCAGLWANIITYTAIDGPGAIEGAFDLPVQTQSFNPETGTGSISFDGDVTEIKDSAFIDCHILASMTLPNTITKIGKSAFEFCHNLTSITLSNTLTTIGDRAFFATDLESITIPNSVTTIGEFAFCGNGRVTSITIPNSVTTIGGSVLTGCTNLTTIKFEGTACQNGIHDIAFYAVGSIEPVTLILPADWETDNLPMNSQTKWHDGYFTSERTFDQYKQAALQEIGNALGEDAKSSIFQDFIAYYQSAINGANKSKFIDGVKDAVIAIIPIIKSTYTTGKTEGLAEAQAALPTDPEGTAGTVVTITKGEKTLKLVNPDSVEYDKQE